MPHMLLRATGLLSLVLTAGCASLIPSFYTPPVRQGNYIDQSTVTQLHSGMSKQQVQRLLGTPLVADPFHQSRWDYYYQYGKGNHITEQRHLTLFFSGDTLDRIDSGPTAESPKN
ncbi:MAG: outer membrane protein assembly factor BamE [Candidatus Competibacteraceae bacterium]|nr:outer membrane protein assembly factor BamE [Candidatus Competibacteraceae bacterium]